MLWIERPLPEPLTLQLYGDYSRKEVRDLFAPTDSFHTGAGKWGVKGIVAVEESSGQLVSAQSGDFVFFVTYGARQSPHIFSEMITESGVFSWQSQPWMALQTPQIKRFIAHDHQENRIYLFLRGEPARPYTYLGKLAYVSHDETREHPVYFQWQIQDWPPPIDVVQKLGITLHLEDVEPSFEQGNETVESSIRAEIQLQRHLQVIREIEAKQGEIAESLGILAEQADTEPPKAESEHAQESDQ